jgi:hypothetical protein
MLSKVLFNINGSEKKCLMTYGQSIETDGCQLELAQTLIEGSLSKCWSQDNNSGLHLKHLCLQLLKVCIELKKA